MLLIFSVDLYCPYSHCVYVYVSTVLVLSLYEAEYFFQESVVHDFPFLSYFFIFLISFFC